MDRNDLPSAVITAVAIVLIVAGVATWTVGGALVTAGVLLIGFSGVFQFEIEVVDETDDEAGES